MSQHPDPLTAAVVPVPGVCTQGRTQVSKLGEGPIQRGQLHAEASACPHQTMTQVL